MPELDLVRTWQEDPYQGLSQKDNKRYPSKFLGKSENYCFSLVYAYTPKGTMVYLGSMDRIESELRNQPTCHGAVYHQRYIIHLPRRVVGHHLFEKNSPDPRKSFKYKFSGFNIFGKHREDVSTYYFRFYIYSEYNYKIFKSGISKSVLHKNRIQTILRREKITSHKRHYLFLEKQGFFDWHRFIGSWRKLPAKYISLLSDSTVSRIVGIKAETDSS